jgi:hypothetical protein
LTAWTAQVVPVLVRVAVEQAAPVGVPARGQALVQAQVLVPGQVPVPVPGQVRAWAQVASARAPE